MEFDKLLSTIKEAKEKGLLFIMIDKSELSLTLKNFLIHNDYIVSRKTSSTEYKICWKKE